MADSGDINAALKELSFLPELPEAVLASVNLLIQRTLQQSPGAQDWSGAERALTRADDMQADELSCHLLRGALAEGQGKIDDARKILEAATTQWPQEPRVWTAVTRLAAHPQERAWAAHLLDHSSEVSDSAEMRKARIQQAMMTPRKHVLTMLRELEEGIETFSNRDQSDVLETLGRAYLLLGTEADAVERLQRASILRPDLLELHLLCFDAALATNATHAIESTIRRMEAIEGEDGVHVGCARAAWMVEMFASGHGIS